MELSSFVEYVDVLVLGSTLNTPKSSISQIAHNKIKSPSSKHTNLLGIIMMSISKGKGKDVIIYPISTSPRLENGISPVTILFAIQVIADYNGE